MDDKPKVPVGPHPAARLDQPIIELNLTHELEALRQSESYRASDHSAVTLVKRDELSIVLVALKPGGHMEEHRADAPITVRVLEGHVRFAAGGETFELFPHQLLAVAAGKPHRVTAAEESAFMLTIAGIHRSR